MKIELFEQTRISSSIEDKAGLVKTSRPRAGAVLMFRTVSIPEYILLCILLQESILYCIVGQLLSPNRGSLACLSVDGIHGLRTEACRKGPGTCRDASQVWVEGLLAMLMTPSDEAGGKSTRSNPLRWRGNASLRRRPRSGT